MAAHPPRSRLHQSAPLHLAGAALALLLWLMPSPALATGISQHYRCDGDPLVATAHSGAVDAADIPNSSAGTLPGAFIVLEWRGLSLQLPRTNNAGSPSYTDGRWWWQAEDEDQPEFAERRGAVHNVICQRVVDASPQP